MPGTLSPQEEQAINDWHQQWLEFEIAVETNGLTPLQAMAADLWSGASGLVSNVWSAVISPSEAAEVRIYSLDSSANVVEQRNPTAAAQALRATTAEVLRSIERDPSMAVNQLTPGETRRLATEPWRQHMLFGTVVERMVADAGRSRPDRVLLEHHQGNGPNDFSAIQQLTDRGYDLTTFNATSEHLRHRPEVQTVVGYRVANSVKNNFFQEAYSRNQFAELVAATRDATAGNYRLPGGVRLSMYLPMQIQRPPARPPVTPRR